MKRLQPRLVVVVLSAGVVLGLGAVLDQRTRAEEREALSWVSHTLDVLAQVEGVRAALSEAATAQRSFILTGDPTFLQELAESRRDVEQGLQRLGQETSDNPPQRARVETLSLIAARTLARLDDTARIRQEEGSGAAAKRVEAGESRRTLEEARTVLAEMRTSEQLLLRQRQERLWSKARQTREAFLLLVMAGLAGLLIAYGATALGERARRRALTVLASTESRFRLLVDAVSEYAIFGLDPSGHVSSWNTGAERLKQYKAAEILGKHFSVFYPPELVDTCAAELETAARTGRFETEGWRLRKDGSRFWAHVVINPMRDEAGQLIGFAKVTQNLTEARQAEESRLQLAQAAEAIRLRDSFLSIASHELRTPLTSLALQLQQAQRKLEREEGVRPELLARSLRQVRRLQRLIDDLLDLAALQAGKVRMQEEDVDIVGIAEEVLTDLAPTSPTHLLTLDKVGAPHVRGDRHRLEQVLTNLIHNAIKYSPQGGPIVVRVSATDDGARVDVTDSGIGIPHAEQAQVFGRFFRAQNASAGNYGGLGLGLFLSSEFVRRHGGRLEVKSHPGEGSTFSVVLPTPDPAPPAKGTEDGKPSAGSGTVSP